MDVVILHPWRDITDDEAPLQFVEKSGHCYHRNTKLDRDAHKLLCRECDAEVDPFAFLVRLTGEWSRWVDARESAKKRADAAEARLAETLRLEKNARARLKRLDPRIVLPDVPWGR